jgi:uncharacterized membrane protein YoaK (UPF0700 family)
MEMADGATNSAEQMLYGTLLILTFVSGLVDAASFLALGHVFTANMTGNVVLMAFALAGTPELSSLRSFIALLSALAGAAVAGHLDSRIRWEKRTSWLSIALVIEAAVLAIAAFVAWSGRVQPAEQSIVCVVIALTGFAMGVRNGTVRRLGVPDLTTTVLTLTVAGLAFDSSIAGGANARWRIRVAAISMMFLGAVAGALVLRHSLVNLLGLSALLVTSCAVLQLFREETNHEVKLKGAA